MNDKAVFATISDDDLVHVAGGNWMTRGAGYAIRKGYQWWNRVPRGVKRAGTVVGAGANQIDDATPAH